MLSWGSDLLDLWPTTRVESRSLNDASVLPCFFGKRGIKFRLGSLIQHINYRTSVLQNCKSTTGETASLDQRFIFNDTALENISYR